ncbi:MAG: hypothetical protein HYU28_10475 [Actinobacteria bacterium]|nr:hypothetical protein [Actinomycetota bacterium]
MTRLSIPTRGLSPWRRYQADAALWFSPDEIARGRAYVRPLGWMGALEGVLAAGIVLAFVDGKVAADAIEWSGMRGWALELLIVVAARCWPSPSTR